MTPEFRPRVVLATLAQHEVDFVVIGGMAGVAQGSALPTYDLDVAYARDRGNLERLVAALRELQATPRGAPPEVPFVLDAKTLENGSHFTFDTPYGPFDILSDPVGAPRYELLKKAAVDTEIEGTRVLVASLDHLIGMKKATGRSKDEYMAMEYRTLADEIARRRRS